MTVSNWQRKKAEYTPHKLLRTQTMLMTALPPNTPTQAETLLYSLERAAADIGLYVKANKPE